MLRKLLIFSSYIFLTCWPALPIFAQTEPAGEASADTGYISDFLIINVRDNIETPYTVIGTVRSNEKVRILEEQGKYFHIETMDGKNGWIAKQYVTRRTPKPLIITRLKAQLEELKAKTQDCAPGTDTAAPDKDTECQQQNARLAEAGSRIIALEQHLSTCSQELSRATGNIAKSDCAAQTASLEKQLKKAEKDYQVLSQEYQKRGARIAALENRLAKENDRSRYYWFAAGAAVFLVGLLFGSFRSRKRDRYIY